MKRKGTGMSFRAAMAAMAALLAALPLAAAAQAGGNPWNPYPSPAPVPAPSVAQQPQYAPPVTAMQTPVAPGAARQQAPSRFAPPGLEQQLAAGPQMRFAPADQPARPQPQGGPVITPPAYFTPPQGGYGRAGYAQPGNGFGVYAPGAFGPPGQGYGGYPQGYGNNGFAGYGPNGPLNPYAIPGGPGGFAPFPGTITNGGVPGFNFSPFGFF